MILGFGSTEKETALRIIEECAIALKTNGIQGIKDIQAKYAESIDPYDGESIYCEALGLRVSASN